MILNISYSSFSKSSKSPCDVDGPSNGIKLKRKATMGNYGLKSEDGREVVIVMLVFGVISLSSTILRIVSRRMRSISLGLDDYSMISATVRSSNSLSSVA